MMHPSVFNRYLEQEQVSPLFFLPSTYPAAIITSPTIIPKNSGSKGRRMKTDPASTHRGPAIMDRTAYLAGIRPGRNRAPDMGRNRTAPLRPMDMKLH